ncbi:hypothetical protein HDR58_00140 [bacterium]|nr:hypothetical protein [bacterium]
MRCACCGRKKKVFESFENLGEGGEVCVDCSDIMYRIHDAVAEERKEEYDLQVKAVKIYLEQKKASADFTRWFEDDFMKRNAFPR